ncbi:hypothetical protein ACI3PL_26085, partial [Lacticaseibacillus paracasei]
IALPIPFIETIISDLSKGLIDKRIIKEIIKSKGRLTMKTIRFLFEQLNISKLITKLKELLKSLLEDKHMKGGWCEQLDDTQVDM